jgi:hypothetical protein
MFLVGGNKMFVVPDGVSASVACKVALDNACAASLRSRE